MCLYRSEYMPWKKAITANLAPIVGDDIISLIVQFCLGFKPGEQYHVITNSICFTGVFVKYNETFTQIVFHMNRREPYQADFKRGRMCIKFKDVHDFHRFYGMRCS